ncbi:MAG: ABC transporter ATP-binding protein [Pseudomonadota bacterium]|jgi:lipoprotein-releasing system ATP-binding protein|nr:ABC transporter ATP-binding protein [Pseudomonadota bacterium]MEC9236110.1 ABC transporter ATP-binding protein [Pseudomonadota bacterium]MED5423351.1 ABC transporter ATP-binding protein [Pseudomonadota bacterium]MEE3323115.1 ABC transporter ATP-binding protein [Pseudomonadota bacterium]
MSDAVLKLSGLTREFKQGGETLQVLKGIDLEIGKGEIVALVGQSGAGKSTLLHQIGLLDRPSTGTIEIEGKDATKMNDHQRTMLRRSALGFVYQFHYLQPDFSAEENIIIPQMIAGRACKDAAVRADKLLGALGLSARASHRPARLSGGEQQRVAIARALANKPHLILADEPTGNLDPETADHVFSMLVRIVRQTGISALIATHNLDLADKMDRVVELRDGLLS